MARSRPALLASLAVLSMLAAACARDAAGAGEATQQRAPAPAPAADSKPALPPVLAEATNPGIPLVVQVIEAKRATADTVRVALAFTNTSTSQEPLPLFAALAGGVASRDGAVAAGAGESAAAASVRAHVGAGGTADGGGGRVAGSAAEVNPTDFCLITADGARRLFLLRDAQNKPVLDGNWQPLKPGERRVVHAMFPAPPAQAGRVTLLLGKLVVRDVPISQ